MNNCSRHLFISDNGSTCLANFHLFGDNSGVAPPSRKLVDCIWKSCAAQTTWPLSQPYRWNTKEYMAFGVGLAAGVAGRLSLLVAKRLRAFTPEFLTGFNCIVFSVFRYDHEAAEIFLLADWLLSKADEIHIPKSKYWLRY